MATMSDYDNPSLAEVTSLESNASNEEPIKYRCGLMAILSIFMYICHMWSWVAAGAGNLSTKHAGGSQGFQQLHCHYSCSHKNIVKHCCHCHTINMQNQTSPACSSTVTACPAASPTTETTIQTNNHTTDTTKKPAAAHAALIMVQTTKKAKPSAIPAVDPQACITLPPPCPSCHHT